MHEAHLFSKYSQELCDISHIPEYDVNICVHVCMHACVFVGRNVCECLCVNELVVYLSVCDIIKNTNCVE